MSSMTSAIACTRCGRQLQLPPELQSKPAMCPGCGFVFVPQANGTLLPATKLATSSSREKRSPRNPWWKDLDKPIFRPSRNAPDPPGPDDVDPPVAEVDDPAAVDDLASLPGVADTWSGPVPPIRRRRPMAQVPHAPVSQSAPAVSGEEKRDVSRRR